MKKTLLEILMKYLLTDLAHKSLTLTVLMKYHINILVIIVHQ